MVALLGLLTYISVSLSTLESRTAWRQYQGARALYAARAGLSRALAELAQDPGWPGTSRQDLEEDTWYSVQVTSSPLNATASLRRWRVTCTGGFGEARRTLTSVLEDETFSKYLYFTNSERSASGSTIWFVSADRLTGPSHSNGFLSIYGQPRFSDRVVTANQGDPYFDASTMSYRQGGRTYTDPALFYHYYSSYASDRPTALNGSPSFSFAGGQEAVDLPTSATTVRSQADLRFSDPTGHPYDPNAAWSLDYDPANGTVTGVFRNGRPVAEAQAPPVYRMRFEASGRLLVYQKRTGSPDFDLVGTVDTTDPAGVTVYADGLVLLEGTVRGRVTLGTEHEVHLTGDLVYADPAVDVLGLVSRTDILVEADPRVARDRTVHAAMMALNGSFSVADYNLGRPRGTLHVLGGITQKYRGPVGTFGSQGIVTGYSKDYAYDARLASQPPPDFPTTGKVTVRSLLDRGAVGSQ